MSRPRSVKLQFKHLDTPNQDLMVQVVDAQTGEICLVQSIPHIASWLRNLGYSYVQGTNGVWTQSDGAPANVVSLPQKGA